MHMLWMQGKALTSTVPEPSSGSFVSPRRLCDTLTRKVSHRIPSMLLHLCPISRIQSLSSILEVPSPAGCVLCLFRTYFEEIRIQDNSVFTHAR